MTKQIIPSPLLKLSKISNQTKLLFESINHITNEFLVKLKQIIVTLINTVNIYLTKR